MKLLLKRIARKQSYTIGNLYIDGEWFCNTLEDADRGLDQSMSKEKIKELKVYGKTAIPTGTYKVRMDVVSQKFKNRSWAKPYNGKLPRLVDVPGYEGVLIHVGNSDSESLGCVLVGKNTVKGKVTDSANTFKALMSKLQGQDDITITIE